MNNMMEGLGSNFIYKTLKLVHIQNGSDYIGILKSGA